MQGGLNLSVLPIVGIDQRLGCADYCDPTVTLWLGRDGIEHVSGHPHLDAICFEDDRSDSELVRSYNSRKGAAGTKWTRHGLEFWKLLTDCCDNGVCPTSSGVY